MTSHSGIMEVVEYEGLVPACPQCGVGLSELRARRLNAVGTGTFAFGRRYVHLCPECRAILAVTHRKGFWTG